jgi:hypothetical protein
VGTGTAGLLAPAAALDRVHRYPYEELGAQRGRAGVEPGRARALPGALRDPQDRAGEEADGAVRVVVSGSSQLLAAVHGATVPQ